MEEFYEELLTALEDIEKAVVKDLGRVAICVPAVKAFELALFDHPWLSWELAVQFHLGKDKYEHVMSVLYSVGELEMRTEIDDLILNDHYSNVEDSEKQMGRVCVGCYKRVKYSKSTYLLYCSMDCLFEKEVGEITVPTHLAPPYQFINEFACIYTVKASEFNLYII